MMLPRCSLCNRRMISKDYERYAVQSNAVPIADPPVESYPSCCGGCADWEAAHIGRDDEPPPWRRQLFALMHSQVFGQWQLSPYPVHSPLLLRDSDGNPMVLAAVFDQTSWMRACQIRNDVLGYGEYVPIEGAMPSPDEWSAQRLATLMDVSHQLISQLDKYSEEYDLLLFNIQQARAGITHSYNEIPYLDEVEP